MQSTSVEGEETNLSLAPRHGAMEVRGVQMVEQIPFWCCQVRRYQEELASLREATQLRGGRGVGAQPGVPGSRESSSTAAQRDQLLNSSAKLEKTGARLKQSRQLLAGMEVTLSVLGLYNLPPRCCTTKQ